MSERIPAWKRLGLKLKYAKEEPDAAELSRFQRTNSESSDAIHLRFDDSSAQIRPTKRRRLNVDESSQTQLSSNNINGHSHHETSRQTNHATRPPGNIATEASVNGQANSESASGKRKRVSFVDNELSENQDRRPNGDSLTNVSESLDKTVKQSSRENLGPVDNAILSSTNDVATVSKPTELFKPSGTALNPGIKEMISKKRKVQQKGSIKKPSAALDYLSQHHEDRSSWKFNKNKDIWILNHAHDEEAVPRSFDLALAGYVHGLPEQAASRNRLLDECKKSLDSSITNISLPEADKQKMALLDAMQDNGLLSNNEKLLQRLQKVPRSLILLWALGSSHQLTNSKPRANKKSRTSAPIDLSSTSSSDMSDSESESSNTSDNSDAKEKLEPRGQAEKVNGKKSSGNDSDESTSSSGSDTSSESS